MKGKVKPSKKMGYVSSVEDARKQLEDLYKLKDNKERHKNYPSNLTKVVYSLSAYLSNLHKSVL